MQGSGNLRGRFWMGRGVLGGGEGIGELAAGTFSSEIDDTALRGVVSDHNEYIMKVYDQWTKLKISIKEKGRSDVELNFFR